jgi:hypothetical protein
MVPVENGEAGENPPGVADVRQLLWPPVQPCPGIGCVQCLFSERFYPPPPPPSGDPIERENDTKWMSKLRAQRKE